MSDFTIQEVLAQREFDTQNGPMVAYKVRFKGDQGVGEAETKRKASSAAPAPGETIDAELIEGKFGPELKRIFAQKNGGGFGGGGKSPEQQKQIVRQHSQEMAVLWTATLSKEGKLKEDSLTPDGLKRLVSWFQQDAET